MDHYCEINGIKLPYDRFANQKEEIKGYDYLGCSLIYYVNDIRIASNTIIHFYKLSKEQWEAAQALEFSEYSITYEQGIEIYKNTYFQYFQYLGIECDLKGKSILEIGSSAFPALNYCYNYSKSYIIEPMASDILNSICTEIKVSLIKFPAEQVEFPKVDEIWIMNLFQHVIDPNIIIDKCKEAASVIRFFEPINTGLDGRHIWSFDINYFINKFGNCVKLYTATEDVHNFHQHECCYGVWIKEKPIIVEPIVEKENVPVPAIEIKAPESKYIIQAKKADTITKYIKFKDIPKYAITLPHCVDRQKLVRGQFERIGFDVNFFMGVDKNTLIVPEGSNLSKGQYACMLAHISLIQFAKRHNLPSICIFEDDVIFCDDFWDRINYVDNLKLDYDIFYLGGHFAKENMGEDCIETTTKYIYKAVHFGGTYAYILTSAVYDYILENIQAGNGKYGIDQFYSEVVLSKFKSYAFMPLLASCIKCKSEVTDSVWDYDNVHWFYQQNKLEI